MELGADGFNGDTLDGVNQTWWEEGQRQGRPLVIEPEILMSNYSFLSYNAMSWGYWTPGARTSDLLTPYVSMYVQGCHQGQAHDPSHGEASTEIK